jgi:hypothetical protein
VGPVGSAGEPKDRGIYLTFEAEGTTIYLARELWEQTAGEGELLRALMPGYGEARFRFERTSSRLGQQGDGEKESSL